MYVSYNKNHSQNTRVLNESVPLYAHRKGGPFPFYSTECFQYWHTEEGSGDLESIHVNIRKAIIELVMCKVHN